jgi:hypothetical protein
MSFVSGLPFNFTNYMNIKMIIILSLKELPAISNHDAV